MVELDKPLGWDKSFKNEKFKQDMYIDHMNLPLHEGRISFIQLLEQLVILEVIKEEVMVHIKSNYKDHKFEENL